MRKPDRTRITAPSRRRAAATTPRTQLKAERIQGAAARRPRRPGALPRPPKPEPLAWELLRDSLAKLPGWRIKGGNRALVRRYGFPGPSPRAAAAFAVFVLELAEAGGFHAWVEVRQNVAVVTLFTPRAHGVTLVDLQFAATLGGLSA